MNETLFGRDMIRNLHVYVWKLPIYRDNTRPGNFTWLHVRYVTLGIPRLFSSAGGLTWLALNCVRRWIFLGLPAEQQYCMEIK